MNTVAKKKKRRSKDKTLAKVILASSILDLILGIIEFFKLALEFFEKFLE